MSETQFGSSREDLATRSTVYARDLFAGKTVVVTGACLLYTSDAADE